MYRSQQGIANTNPVAKLLEDGKSEWLDIIQEIERRR